ncbi:hypothetical protein RFI_00521 [Reticulomyxa filosa]|uniref:Uncharacterized protein n=1 Tax=Reticulomyxa filosa TaxID=46433 RepID=X6PE96_RETFI|nr:hypothetical protein RFI_00521 [Reticulomyxa filosa]|eukprot:ETO36541.1 hypothetical protein RFI_00521 [Reticulomyxa filosa]
MENELEDFGFKKEDDDNWYYQYHNIQLLHLWKCYKWWVYQQIMYVFILLLYKTRYWIKYKVCMLWNGKWKDYECGNITHKEPLNPYSITFKQGKEYDKKSLLIFFLGKEEVIFILFEPLNNKYIFPQKQKKTFIQLLNLPFSFFKRLFTYFFFRGKLKLLNINIMDNRITTQKSHER